MNIAPQREAPARIDGAGGLAGPDANAGGEEFLTFKLGAEDYGIDILKVQEIRGCDPVTRIANAPDHVRGVINLRGSIVPIVDMRIRFGLARAAYDKFTVVIVLNVAGRVAGIVVDSVTDVIHIAPGQRKPAPDFGAALDTRYITGLGCLEDRMLILVDIESLLTGPQVNLFEAGASLGDPGTWRHCT